MRKLACAALCFAFVATTLAMVPSASAAPGVSDVLGAVFDPFKLGRASKEIAGSVDRTMAGLRELEAKANVDVAQRLAEVREIVREVIDAVDRNAANLDAIVQRALKQIQTIERQTYDDAVRLIYRAQCAAEVAMTDTLQRGLAEMISNLMKADPKVKIAGIRLVDVSLTKVEITDPDLAYLSTKKQYLKLLEDTKATDPAILILSRYQNIARFAAFARCHYIAQGLAVRFIEEQAEFERLSLPWLNVVRPSL